MQGDDLPTTALEEAVENARTEDICGLAQQWITDVNRLREVVGDLKEHGVNVPLPRLR